MIMSINSINISISISNNKESELDAYDDSQHQRTWQPHGDAAVDVPLLPLLPHRRRHGWNDQRAVGQSEGSPLAAEPEGMNG
jgi:hypothetical protein